MGAAKVERSTSPLVACSISPSQASSTNPTVDSATSYYSPAMDMDPKDMPETAFVIAFCVKFRSAINNISFWPEDLDEAICCKEGPHALIESLHKAFVQNLELKKLRTSWVKRLAKLINEWREKGHDFFADYNPIERTNYDYYGMSNRDKVMIMQVLVSWQLAESPEIKRIRKEHNEIVNDDDVKPLEVEVLGEDTSGSRYYYIGIGVRIYRESMISGRVKWETVSSTVEELKKFIFDYQGLDPNRSDQEQVLYNKLVNTVLPYLEPLENERKRLKELKENKVERERELRLKRIEKDHNDSEILLVRTRSQAKQSIHKEVKNTTGYLEIIKKPTDPINITVNNDKVVANTSVVDPSNMKVEDNDNNTIKVSVNPTTIQEAVESGNSVKEVMDPITNSEDMNPITNNEDMNLITNSEDMNPITNSEDMNPITNSEDMNPITNSEDKDLSVTNKVIDSTANSSIQKTAEKDIIEDPLIEISKTIEIAIECKDLLDEDVTVADTLNEAVSEDLLDRDDKRPIKDERTEKDSTLDNSCSKMNLSTILTEEVSREAESVEQRSELSKMSICNILSSESSDVVHTDNKYFDEVEMDNGNDVFVQYGDGSVVSYEFDTIVQKSNNETSKENEEVAPVAAVKEQKEQDDLQQDSNTPISNDTIKTPWAPAVKKNREDKTEEANDDTLSEPQIKRAFVPDEETMIKLEWSLNHPVFRLDEEVFGESTETDLSDCCSDCAMDID